jgi:Flp pilus assembly pilin Flp
MLRRFVQDEQGQVAEVILIIALAIVAITVVVVVGGAVNSLQTQFTSAWGTFWAWFNRTFSNFGGGA